jgi:hypothetical protein
LEEYAVAIVKTVKDYRVGEIEPIGVEHVLKWSGQFPVADRAIILSELSHVLGQTYVNQKDAKKFLSNLSKNPKLAGDNQKSFWKNTTLLEIQKNGHSQEEMNKLFKSSLLENDFELAKNGASKNYIYLDDALFTGNRARNDLEIWISEFAPNECSLELIFMITHSSGEWYLSSKIRDAIKKSGKNIKHRIWRALEIENKKSNRNISDVLWPTTLTASSSIYSGGKFPFEPREAGGDSKIFSSDAARGRLEQALLEAGMKIRGFSANPSSALRPLGFSPFGVGFGTTIATYRNCPNNAPLAIWWGDPTASLGHPFRKWLPLLPRKTYEHNSYEWE